MKTPKEIIGKIKRKIETQYNMGGLSDGLYGDYATDVAIEYTISLLQSDIEELRGMIKEIKPIYNFGDIIIDSSKAHLGTEIGQQKVLFDLIQKKQQQLKTLTK